MTKYDYQTLGWLYGGTYGDDNIDDATVQTYLYGKYNFPWGDFPMEKRELVSMFTGADVTPQQNYFGKRSIDKGVSFTAINGIPLYWALGRVNNSGVSDPYTHIAGPRQIGSDPPFVNDRTEDDSSASNGLYDHFLGLYTKNLNFNLNLADRSSMATYALQQLGQRRVAPDDASATSFTGRADAEPIAPGSHDDHYRPDTNFKFLWDTTLTSGNPNWYDNGLYSSGGDVLTEELHNFSLTIDNTMRMDKPDSQDYPDNYIFGEMALVASFEVYREGTTAKNLKTDFDTMSDNSTTKNAHIKIYQNANHYIQIDMANFTLGHVKRDHTRGTERIPTFKCHGLFTDIRAKIVDPLPGGTWYA